MDGGEQKVNLNKVFFHGSNFKKWKESPVANPSVHTPVYLSEFFSEASSYGQWVFPVFLREDAKVFSWYEKENVLSLMGDTIYQDDTIKLLADIYADAKDGPWFNLWAMGHQYYDKKSIPFLKKVLVKEMKDSGDSLTAVDIPQNVNDFLGLRTSTLRYPIYHGGAEECAFSTADKNAAKFILEESKRAGYGTFHDMIVVNMGKDEMDYYRLKVMMYADIIDALATNTYPISYMSLRRPIYLAIQKKGYSVILDSGSDGENHNDEIVVISKDGLESILSEPIAGRNFDGNYSDDYFGNKMMKLQKELTQKDEITKEDFESILNESN